MQPTTMLRLLAGSATLALAPAPAAAEDTRCSQNADGAVTCTRAGAATASGTATPGVVVDAPGLVLQAPADAAIAMTGAIVTESDGLAAVSAAAGGAFDARFSGPLATSGAQAIGFEGRFTSAAWETPIAVSLGTVTTSGDGAGGIAIDSVSGFDLSCGQVSTSGAGADAIRLSVEPFGGPINLSCGAIEATGAGASGVLAFSDFGGTMTLGAIEADRVGFSAGTEESSLSVTLGAVTVHGDDGYGVYLGAGDSLATLSCAGITTHGARSPGLWTGSSDGAVSVTCGAITTFGAGSTGALLWGSGRYHLGDIQTFGEGSTGVAAGQFYGVGLTVGDVRTAGNDAAGIVLTDEGGRLTAGDITTLGDNSPGILAYDPWQVTVGQIRTSGAQSHGIAMSPSYYGPERIEIATAGVAVTGAGADAVRVYDPERNVGPTDYRLASSGDLTSADGNAVLIRVGGGFAMAVGEGREVRGRTGAILVEASATTLDIAGAVRAAQGDSVRVNGGAATVTVAASGRVEGALSFGAGDDLYANRGTTLLRRDSGFGDGSDRFVNEGVLTVDGTIALAGLERFENAGLVALADGSTGDRLTLSGDYVGAGGATLALDVMRDLGAGDQLVVAGTASGSTLLEIAWLGEGTPGGAGLLLVDGGGMANFALSEASQGGLLRYRLTERSGDLYLESLVDPRTGDLAAVVRAASGMWHQSAEAMRASLAGRVANPRRWSTWAQLYASRDHQRSGRRGASLFGTPVTLDQRQDSERQGAQLGADVRLGRVVLGVSGGYQRLAGEAGEATRLSGDGHNLAAYGRWSAPSGFHVGVIAKRDRLDMGFANRLSRRLVRFDARARGVDVEAGWSGRLGPAALALDAGLAAARARFASFELYGARLSAERDRSLRSRAGARLAATGRWPVYLDLHATREWRDGPALDVALGSAADRLDGAGKGSWARIETGVAAPTGALLALWGDVGQRRGLGFRAGFRF